MKKVVKGVLLFIGVVLSVACLFGQSWAMSLSFNPSIASIEVGDSFDVDIVISDLEESHLGVFDFNLNYDNTVLASNGYTLGVGLGDLGIGDAASDWSRGDLGGGVLNLSELSWLSDLSSQPDSFTLATVSFLGTGLGHSPLSFSDVILGDELGDPLSADLGTGSVGVSASAPVPVPSTLLLLGSGIAGLAGFRKRFGKRHSRI